MTIKIDRRQRLTKVGGAHPVYFRQGTHGFGMTEEYVGEVDESGTLTGKMAKPKAKAKPRAKAKPKAKAKAKS